MINVFLQVGGFFGGGFGQLLNQWEQAGVFDFLLPFLLIFALIFGILQKMNLFGDTSRGINAIIALSVGLMALQFGFVSQFFAEIFPQLGAGIAIILVGLILMGLFTDTNQTGIFFGLGIIILGFILWNTFDFGNVTLGYWFTQNFWDIAAIIVVFAIVLAAVFGAPSFSKQDDNVLAGAIRALSGGKKP